MRDIPAKIHLQVILVALLALSGCGNDHTGVPPSTPVVAIPAIAVRTAPAEPLNASGPIATEGAVRLSLDCNLEAVDGRLFATDPIRINGLGQHVFAGWVVDPQSRSIPHDLRLVVAGVGNGSGIWVSSPPLWVERRGVAVSRGYGAGLIDSGFLFRVDSSGVPKGLYHVFAISSGGSRPLTCDPGRQLYLQ